MTSNKVPAINVRGVRQSMPSPYVLGRVAPGLGPVQLLPLTPGGPLSLISALKAQGFGSATFTYLAELGIFLAAGGNIAYGQYYYAAIAPCKATFPSTQATAASVAKAGKASVSTVVIYIVNNLTSFATGGYPNGCIASVTFTSSATGVISWVGAPVTVNAGDILYAVTAPSFNDSTIEGIEILLVGDYVSG